MKNKQEIINELHELGIDIPAHENPYKVPENFFQNFESQLKEKIEEEDFLQSLPKNNPYQVPEHYFETFPQQIIQKINESKPVIQPMRKVSPVFSYFSIAASIIVLLGLSFWMMNKESKPNFEQELAAIPLSEIQDYVSLDQTNLHDEFYLENLNENQIDINSLEKEIYQNYNLNTISNEELNKFVF